MPDHTINNNRIANILEEEVTVGYRPVIPLEAMWLAGGGDMPQITLRRDIEFMQMHPIIATTLDYYKSGIAGAEFWGGPDQANPQGANPQDPGRPISKDPRVAQFVAMHVERFWRSGMPQLQEGGYPYGWAPGEHIYKESSGMLVWDHLKTFHPNDGFVLTHKNQPVGIRVKNIKESPHANQPSGGLCDLWFAHGHVPAKAAWYPHRPRFNQFYGRSQLIAAWRPWRRLGWRDAVEQVIDAAVYRGGYKGPIVRHPPEDMATAQVGIPATQKDGANRSYRSARDVARQIVEWAKAGAGFTLSSAHYPANQGGGYKWDLQWPDHVMDVRPLIEAAKYLEDQIMLGIGVPPELVKSGGTGSGYSGRSIPREAFLDQQQHIADAMLEMFIEQVVRPLVLWNFGEVPFNIQCKSLLKSQTQDTQGQGSQPSGDVNFRRSQAAKDAWAIRKLNQPGGGGGGQVGVPHTNTGIYNAAQWQAHGPSAGKSMSLEERVLEVVRRVAARAA